MRKKLERRLAARKVPGAPEHDAMLAEHIEPGDGESPRDERSITELLDFIGAGNSTQTGRGGRKGRRKRAAAQRRRAMAGADATESRKGTVLTCDDNTVKPCKPCVKPCDRSLEDGDIDIGCGSSRGSYSNATSPHGGSQDEAEVGIGEEDLAMFAGSNEAMDFADPVDKEVEEFRRLLEAAHANPGRRTMVHVAKPVAY